MDDKKKPVVRFGPSSNDVLFYEQGHKSSREAPAWLAKMGLTAYEISFGRGIRLSTKTAGEIGDEAKKHGVEISVHAPYYINLANADPVRVQNAFGYIKRSLVALHALGGNRIVVHIGSQGDQTRENAILNCKVNLKTVIELLDADEEIKELGIKPLICIEVMGRHKWIGDVDEILEICKVDERVIPCLDFGHINAWMLGELQKNPEMIIEIMTRVSKSLGAKKMQNIHIHFSHIIYGKSGEVKHTVLDDAKWSVPFEPLAKFLKDNNLGATIICESQGTMAQDAVKLKGIFEGA